MYSKRGNKEYTSLKYNIEKVNKEIQVLEQIRNLLNVKFVENTLEKICNFLIQTKKLLRKNDGIIDTKGMLFYKWICPYCGAKQETHYELDRHKRYWKDNDW